MYLREQLAIPNLLSDVGIDTTQVKGIGKQGFQDPSAAGNPIAFNKKQCADNCQAAVFGKR